MFTVSLLLHKRLHFVNTAVLFALEEIDDADPLA
jgi:hypothetical protein